jgi:hypothetical protein
MPNEVGWIEMKMVGDLLLAQKGISYTIPIGKLDKGAVF